MNDKTREEFEEWFESTGINSTFSEALFSPWLAAKEKYEPRNCEWLYDEDTDSYDTQCGGKFQTIADSIEDNGIDFCCYCGGEISDAPSTQGGGE